MLCHPPQTKGTSLMFDIRTSVRDYMSIATTHECNRQCPFCVDAYRGSCEYISGASVAGALLAAKESKIRDILLVGGEPTLHPQIVDIAKRCRAAGFRTILTTNYSHTEVVKALDGIVNSFNISWYGQAELPTPEEYRSDITLSALIFRGQLDTKEKLDAFIDKHAGIQMKFSTLTPCNSFCVEHQKTGYLDELPGGRVRLFNEIEGILYRGCVIKRYDRVANDRAEQSLKCHVDGTLARTWERTALTSQNIADATGVKAPA